MYVIIVVITPVRYTHTRLHMYNVTTIISYSFFLSSFCLARINKCQKTTTSNV